MPDGTDWLISPVMAGMCKYESLLDGTIGLEDIARMNDAIAVRAENNLRIHDYNMRSRNNRG